MKCGNTLSIYAMITGTNTKVGWVVLRKVNFYIKTQNSRGPYSTSFHRLRDTIHINTSTDIFYFYLRFKRISYQSCGRIFNYALTFANMV